MSLVECLTSSMNLSNPHFMSAHERRALSLRLENGPFSNYIPFHSTRLSLCIRDRSNVTLRYASKGGGVSKL